MNYKISQKVLFVFCIIAILAIIAYFFTEQQIFFYILVGAFLGGFAQGIIFYRCPVCRKSLMRHGRAVPQKCPHCQSDIG